MDQKNQKPTPVQLTGADIDALLGLSDEALRAALRVLKATTNGFESMVTALPN